MLIAIDFDGTVVTHEFPHVGQDIGAVPVLQALVAKGHKIMLWTMRSELQPDSFRDAVEWFKAHDIPLMGINLNPTQKWSSSHKQFADLYIDDAALGCPLKYDSTISERPFVDWEAVEKMLKDRKIL